LEDGRENSDNTGETAETLETHVSQENRHSNGTPHEYNSPSYILKIHCQDVFMVIQHNALVRHEQAVNLTFQHPEEMSNLAQVLLPRPYLTTLMLS
jgi:hypothetical protein